ncbi:MAG TPA: DUF4177 domain-containing protein [Gaiellaceae bacterium]
MPEYEYKFVRIGENRLSAVFGVQDRARRTYETLVEDHARDGWRLVQIFAPGVAAFGAAKYYELILEREKPLNGKPEQARTTAAALRR